MMKDNYIRDRNKEYYEQERIVYIVEPSVEGYYGFRRERSFNSDAEAIDFTKEYSKEVGCEMMLTKEMRKGKVLQCIRGWVK